MAAAVTVPRTSGPHRGEQMNSVVLVVEDDPMLCELLGLLLEGEGYAVAYAHDGESALRLASELQPALISLDLGLPRLDGQAVLDRLASHRSTRSIPVVVFSSDVDDLRPTKQVREVLLKPGGIQRFLGAVDACLTEAVSGAEAQDGRYSGRPR